jgi:hypothetical protein
MVSGMTAARYVAGLAGMAALPEAAGAGSAAVLLDSDQAPSRQLSTLAAGAAIVMTWHHSLRWATCFEK